MGPKAKVRRDADGNIVFEVLGVRVVTTLKPSVEVALLEWLDWPSPPDGWEQFAVFGLRWPATSANIRRAARRLREGYREGRTPCGELESQALAWLRETILGRLELVDP